MTIKSRFVLFLSLFTAAVVLILSVFASLWMYQAFAVIEHAPDPTMIPAVASRMFAKFLYSYALVVIASVLISIPVGIVLFRGVSKRYLTLLDELRRLGESRIALTGENSNSGELSTLEEYRRILNDDLDRLQEYEKIKGIQNGARMLIHELKNPLTPLKLNAQKLALRCNDREIERILAATSDIELILRAFRDLVNIDFPAKQPVNISVVTAELCDLIRESYPVMQCRCSPQPFWAESEPTLLKMILINLIKNSVEANPETGFFSVYCESHRIVFETITPDRTIDEPSRIFRPGWSQKGEGRGYGLFICKEIAAYLGASLTVENSAEGVRFQCSIPKDEV